MVLKPESWWLCFVIFFKNISATANGFRITTWKLINEKNKVTFKKKITSLKTLKWQKTSAIYFFSSQISLLVVLCVIWKEHKDKTLEAVWWNHRRWMLMPWWESSGYEAAALAGTRCGIPSALETSWSGGVRENKGFYSADQFQFKPLSRCSFLSKFLILHRITHLAEHVVSRLRGSPALGNNGSAGGCTSGLI